ncbi:hypothetical protein [Gimesia algae]|uniref:hypothetical protein n=1 Tax=Gimesia algae TaxID=2527971 RepID=UPI0011AB131A|nr:hypothetical protein [Gimesia algae]
MQRNTYHNKAPVPFGGSFNTAFAISFVLPRLIQQTQFIFVWFRVFRGRKTISAGYHLSARPTVPVINAFLPGSSTL